MPVTKLGGMMWSLRLAIGFIGIWCVCVCFFISAFTNLVVGGLSSPSQLHTISLLSQHTHIHGKRDQTSMEKTGRDASPNRNKASSKYIQVPQCLVLVIRWSAPHLVIANKLTYTIRIHNSNINSNPFWENLLEHVIILPDPRWNPSFGIIGSLIWPFIQIKMGWSNVKVLIVLVRLGSLMPAYGCLGFLPVFKNKDGGGFGD